MCIDEPAFSCGEEQSLIHWDKTVPPERAGSVEPGSQPRSGFPLLVTRWRLELQKFLSLTQRECLYPSSSNRSPREASHWPFVVMGTSLNQSLRPEGPSTLIGQVRVWRHLWIQKWGQRYLPRGIWAPFPEVRGWIPNRRNGTGHCPWACGWTGRRGFGMASRTQKSSRAPWRWGRRPPARTELSAKMRFIFSTRKAVKLFNMHGVGRARRERKCRFCMCQRGIN